MNITEELEKLKLKHHICVEDYWYNCPLSEDGCGDPDKELRCDCGAEKHNNKIDEIIEYMNYLKELTRE